MTQDILTDEERDILGLSDGVASDQMEQLAGKLMQEALSENASIETRLDVFKAVSAYRLGLLKQKPKKSDEGSKPGVFAAARERIHGVNGTRQ